MTAKEIAMALGISKRAVNMRAIKEGWPYEVTQARGGSHKRYTSLPADVRVALVEASAREVRPAVEAALVPQPPIYIDTVPGGSSRALTPMPAFADPKALAKSDLLRIYTEHMGRIPRGSKEKARRNFMAVYNSGLGYPHIFAKLGKLSWQAIEGWKYKSGGNDFCALTDRRGKALRGQRSITQEQAGILTSCCMTHLKKVSEVIYLARQIMNQRGIANGHSDDTYRRWVDEWASKHYDLWVYFRYGEKGLHDKCLPYIVRDYDKIDVGDVLVADGHKLNFTILNPWTGKPKRMALILWHDMKSSYPCGWEIMPTENVQSIHAALRRAILTLGKIPKVAYLDNGKAFKAKVFTGGTDLSGIGIDGLYMRLGIKTIFAWKYHGQSKTVERMFGTMGQLERLAPTYVGTCIDDKPPHMHMGEKLMRRFHERATGGAVPTIEQAHMAVASWFDDYARRPQEGHLRGACPIDVFQAGRGDGVDERVLRFLMMSEGVRTIRRDGIWHAGQWYYDPVLYGRKSRVKYFYDWMDSSRIYVCDEAGEEILCEARPLPTVHPAATHLGDESDQDALSGQIELKRGLLKETSASARAFAESTVIPETRKRLAAMDVLPEGPKVRQIQGPRPGELTPEETARILAEAEQVRADTEAMQAREATPEPEPEHVSTVEDDTSVIWRKLETMSDADRYEEIEVQRIQGRLIPKKHQAFTEFYEQTDEFARHADYWEEFKVKIAMAYGKN